MSKSVRRRPEEKKIHRVGKQKPERELDQELRRINSVEDLKDMNLDEVLDTYTTIDNNTH